MQDALDAGDAIDAPEPSLESICGAVARGWCSKENSHKEMDVTLAFAIADEVLKLYAPAVIAKPR